MKSLGLVFITLIIIASLLSLSSCVGIEGLQGEQGPPGPITALFIEPDSVSDGDNWNIYGVGFPASTTITLKFKYLDDDEWVDWYDDTATIDENGYFFSEQDEEIAEDMYAICETYIEDTFHGAAQFDCYAINDAEKIAEKAAVQTAVIAMMTENKMLSIPNPINYAGGFAYINMKAFPDNASRCTVDKVYDPTDTAYTAKDKDGFILYGHDKTADDNSAALVNYINLTITTYYYTCEADGTVRQWSDMMMTHEYTD